MKAYMKMAVPALICGSESCIKKEKGKTTLHTAEMRFLRRLNEKRSHSK